MTIDPIRDLYYPSSVSMNDIELMGLSICYDYCVNIASNTCKFLGEKGVENGKNSESSELGFGFLGFGIWDRY